MLGRRAGGTGVTPGTLLRWWQDWGDSRDTPASGSPTDVRALSPRRALTPLSRHRVGLCGGASRRQPADPAAAGAVAEVAGQPGTAAAALRGHQRQRGQRALFQVRGE